jgi:LysM repeat protein
MRRWELALVAVAAVGSAAVVAACSDEGPGSGAPTLPPIRTTSTLPPSTTLNLVNQNRFYEVQQGDNLTRIASRFGVTVEEIMTKNGIENPDAIAVGQVLELPENAVLETTTTSASLPAGTGAP